MFSYSTPDIRAMRTNCSPGGRGPSTRCARPVESLRYPSRSESAHDWVENSHASVSLAWADGIAKAFELRGEHDRRVVAVIGDGALTGGVAWEGLNNLGASGRPVVVVLNDNGRSYHRRWVRSRIIWAHCAIGAPKAEISSTPWGSAISVRSTGTTSARCAPRCARPPCARGRLSCTRSPRRGAVSAPPRPIRPTACTPAG